MNFLEILQNHPAIEGQLEFKTLQKISDYREILLEENTKQNLTRLTEPEAFIKGHLLDVIELNRLEIIDSNPLDWGSGCGVPGLLSAILDEKPWVLIDSEKKKVEFLEAARLKLGLKSVKTQWVRGEAYLHRLDEPKTLVSRAVSGVSKFQGWLEGCSTWNSLILFKGPKWEEEWSDYKKVKNPLFQLKLKHEYSISGSDTKRIIVQLVKA